MQKSMSLKNEPSSELLLISAMLLFFNRHAETPNPNSQTESRPSSRGMVSFEDAQLMDSKEQKVIDSSAQKVMSSLEQ